MTILTSLPNYISIFRLLCVPLIIWLILNGAYVAAFWVFLIAGASDAIDGYLARKLNAQSSTGAYLDPIADKALLVGIYVTLGYQGALPDWLVILVVFRDLLIVGGALFIYTQNGDDLNIDPLWISKLNTTLQIILVIAVLARSSMVLDVGVVIDWLVYLVALSTVLSGGGYLTRWIKGVDA